jgi:hypothetical protein
MAPASAAFALRSGTGMEVFPASVVLIIRALVVSARWARRSRRRLWGEGQTAGVAVRASQQLPCAVASPKPAPAGAVAAPLALRLLFGVKRLVVSWRVRMLAVGPDVECLVDSVGLVSRNATMLVAKMRADR